MAESLEKYRNKRQFNQTPEPGGEAIAVDKGGQELLKTANVGHDAGVVKTNNEVAFITAAKTRQWEREKTVRTLA